MGVSENGVYPQMAMIRAKVWERGFLNQPVLKYELLEIWRLFQFFPTIFRYQTLIWLLD